MTTIRFQRIQTVDISAGDDVSCGQIVSGPWKQVTVREKRKRAAGSGGGGSGTIAEAGTNGSGPAGLGGGAADGDLLDLPSSLRRQPLPANP